MIWGPWKILTTHIENSSPWPLQSSVPTKWTVGYSTSLFFIALGHLVFSVFHNTCTERLQFWINPVCTSISWLNITRGKIKYSCWILIRGKAITQPSISRSQQILGLRSSMPLDNPSKPPYFHLPSKSPTPSPLAPPSTLFSKDHRACYTSARLSGRQWELPQLFVNLFPSGPLLYFSPVSRKKVALPLSKAKPGLWIEDPSSHSWHWLIQSCSLCLLSHLLPFLLLFEGIKTWISQQLGKKKKNPLCWPHISH